MLNRLLSYLVLSPSSIPRVRGAWPLGRLVTWLLGYRPWRYRREKKNRKKTAQTAQGIFTRDARIFRFGSVRGVLKIEVEREKK